MENNHFIVLLAIWVFLPKFLGRLMSFAYIEIARNDKSATYSCLSNYSHFVLRSRYAGRSAETYGK